jgi:hypothetical protein
MATTLSKEATSRRSPLRKFTASPGAAHRDLPGLRDAAVNNDGIDAA